MCEILRLLRTKLNHREAVHEVPMCLLYTCILADTPFVLAQKTTKKYFVQAPPWYRRSGAGPSMPNSCEVRREESDNGRNFSPSTSPLCNIPRDTHILLRMYQWHFINLPIDNIFKWHPIRHLSFCSDYSLRRLSEPDWCSAEQESLYGWPEGLAEPHLRRQQIKVEVTLQPAMKAQMGIDI
jgi:hypothetical protein